MLESYAQLVLNLLEVAKQEAKLLNSSVTGTEHLLLAMLKSEESICYFLLDEENINYDMILEKIKKTKIIHKEQDQTFTEKLETIVYNAEVFKNQVGSRYVNEEHVFYCILDDEENIAAEILKNFGLSLNKLKKDIIEIFNFDFEKEPHPLLLNLTKKDLNHPFFERDNYIERIKYILEKKQKNNCLLIGSAGVGKTALVEGLSKKLQNETIYQLDLALVVAGTKYRGELEEKLINALEEVKSKKAILFIDEIHNIVGAGSNDGSLDIANILKPYLSRMDIRIIGATTLDEYYSFFSKDKALCRRFHNIFISEPSIKETKLLLNHIKKSYESFHNLDISHKMINEIVNKTDIYLPNKSFPDKAIDVLDECAVRKKHKKLSFSEIIDEVLYD